MRTILAPRSHRYGGSHAPAALEAHQGPADQHVSDGRSPSHRVQRGLPATGNDRLLVLGVATTAAVVASVRVRRPALSGHGRA